MHPIDRALERIAKVDAEAGLPDMRQTGSGAWRGSCVVCKRDDRMLVGERDLEGGVWFKFYCQCETREALEILDLTWADLKPGSKLDDISEDELLEPSLAAVPPYPVEVLPAGARGLVEGAAEEGLPEALVAGSALAVLAAAVGGLSTVQVNLVWRERPILWIANIAPRGAGKSPSQTRAMRPLHDHDMSLQPGDEDDEAPPSIRIGDTTLEALVRDLHVRQGQACIDIDELVLLLRGLGEYKRGGGGDRGRFLALWDGAPLTFTRVAGGKMTNKASLRIDYPTLVVVGGLQPALHDLLGGEQDGLRPRWLPHLAAMPESADIGAGAGDRDWRQLIDRLLEARGERRTWTLDDHARAEFNAYRRLWSAHQRARETPASLAAALAKAGRHLARIALVLAEADRPAADGVIGVDTINRAAKIVNFTLDCWAALPEQGTMSLSYRDRVLDGGIDRLIGWLEEHGGEATRRELQRACVAGARTSKDLNALLERYGEVYPGCVETVELAGGGMPAVLVKAPARAGTLFSGGAYIAVSAVPTPSKSPKGDTDGVSSADTANNAPPPTGDRGHGHDGPEDLFDDDNGELSDEEKRRRVEEMVARAEKSDDPPWAR